MSYIKTFQFPVSNWTGNKYHHCADDDVTERYPFFTEEEIDDRINRWIDSEHAIVKAISTVPYTIDRHNNGHCDAIILVYTITYEV